MEYTPRRAQLTYSKLRDHVVGSPTGGIVGHQTKAVGAAADLTCAHQAILSATVSGYFPAPAVYSALFDAQE